MSSRSFGNLLRSSFVFALVTLNPVVKPFVFGQQPSTPPLYGGVPPAQNSPAKSNNSGGSATAGVFAPILDSEKRPITAGGFVKTGPVIFQDASEKTGVTGWHHKMGTPQKPFILETIGSGVALLDYDHDGWLDIYFVNGSTYEALDGKAESPHAALFHNNHDSIWNLSACRGKGLAREASDSGQLRPELALASVE